MITDTEWYWSELYTPTLDILPGCWPGPHVLTFVKVSKNTQMNFPYHTEFISQHIHHFKPINFLLKKMLEKINYFPRRGGGGTPFAENSAKIINLIFEPFPYLFVNFSFGLQNHIFNMGISWFTYFSFEKKGNIKLSYVFLLFLISPLI